MEDVEKLLSLRILTDQLLSLRSQALHQLLLLLVFFDTLLLFDAEHERCLGSECLLLAHLGLFLSEHRQLRFKA